MTKNLLFALALTVGTVGFATDPPAPATDATAPKAAAEHKTHDGHKHKHGKKCGHKGEKHADHTDYEHDGHHHKSHDGHTDECDGPEAG